MAAPERPPAWDVGRMATVRCDVATVVPEAEAVVVRVGAREVQEDGSLRVTAAAAARLAPYSARRLHELLAILLRKHDDHGGNP